MKILNIVPTKFIKEFDNHDGPHMLFAHLVEVDSEYVDSYKSMKGLKIMDNSWWELRRDLPVKELVEKCWVIKADVLVLPDIFYSTDFYKKVENCVKQVRNIDKNLKLMGVVKGYSMEDELETFKYFNQNPEISHIAIP